MSLLLILLVINILILFVTERKIDHVTLEKQRLERERILADKRQQILGAHKFSKSAFLASDAKNILLEDHLSAFTKKHNSDDDDLLNVEMLNDESMNMTAEELEEMKENL